MVEVEIKKMIRYALFHGGNGKLRSLVWKSRKKAEQYCNSNKEMKYCVVRKVEINLLEPMFQILPSEKN